MLIRPETEQDHQQVHTINEQAFGSSAEADLVDALREQASPIVSLVAEENGEVLGHILFSPMTMPGIEDLNMMGLAPMAVTPERQKSGIGSSLVDAGLARCRELELDGIVVLGHPEYYPRFGFSPASGFGIRSDYEVPDEVFMAMELAPGALANVSGVVQYHPAFNGL